MSTAAHARARALDPDGVRANATIDSLDFTLPDALVAHEPPEARGLARDEVRLLVSDPDDNSVRHALARDLTDELRVGDILVVNASATINAALGAWRPALGAVPDELIGVHLSSPVPFATSDTRWVVELRRPTPNGTQPLLDAKPGDEVRLRGGGSATLVTPYGAPTHVPPPNGGVRLWEADLTCPGGVMAYAAEHGSPIRYGYVRDPWPLASYQTVFSSEPGSAEMPSAGRPFTPALVAAIEAKGVTIARLVLHTGVASLEAGEAPYPERYRVPRSAADAVNRARDTGGRVVAVGTTAVRALETVAASDGSVSAGAGWTDLVIGPERRVRVVDALITGFHEPRASHLAMLEAIAGRRHLGVAYEAALRAQYLWHEFGDLHLIIRRSPGDARGSMTRS